MHNVPAISIVGLVTSSKNEAFLITFLVPVLAVTVDPCMFVTVMGMSCTVPHVKGVVHVLVGLYSLAVSGGQWCGVHGPHIASHKACYICQIIHLRGDK